MSLRRSRKLAGVSPKWVLVIAGVWVGDASSRTQRGGVGSDRCRRQRSGLVRGVTNRQVVEAIVFRYRSRVAWRDLPERFGPWQMFWADDTTVRGAPPFREEVVRPQ